MEQKKMTHTVKTLTLSLFFAFAAISCSTQKGGTTATVQNGEQALSQQAVDATLWFANSAENQYLFEQTYAYAKILLVEKMKFKQTSKSPGVILDLDETVLDNSPYQLECIRNGTTFNAESWNVWVGKAEAKALPGAISFLRYCEENGIEVFYISNRNSTQLEATLNNLTKLMLPFVNPDHVLLMGDTGDKSERRAMVANRTNVLLLLGDNLLDFENYYEDRTNNYGKATVDKTLKEALDRFVLFPNPMYGQWQKAYNRPLSDSGDTSVDTPEAKAARKTSMAKPSEF